MKTRLLLTALISLFFSISLFANKPETTTFSNIQNTSTGSIKEFTTFDKDTNQPVQKSTYIYDLAGNIQEKVIYNWSKKGWVGHQKLEYDYDSSSQDTPTTLTHTKWDYRTGDWSKHSKQVVFQNNEDGTTAVQL